MNLNLKKYKHVHFIGIGGVSMSGLATILQTNGYSVSGSDMNESEMTKKLSNIGITIYIGHKESNINNQDLVVYTAAIKNDNPEIIKAKEKGIKLLDRAELLGILMKEYSKSIAVAGTHGKTTTTSMLSQVTMRGGLDPTILVGGNVDIIGGNYRIGNSDCFITEACEYNASFLKFNPYIGIILNIDEDHLDFYRDLNHIKETFKEFINIIPEHGYLIACKEDSNVLDILDGVNCNVITYGFENADIVAKNITFDGNGRASFDVERNGKFLTNIKLGTTGKHNILNSLAVIATSLIYDINVEVIRDALSECKGAHKRFEYKGEYNGAKIIDDYAHHPVEIKATLSTAKLLSVSKKYVVFQPHTYTRTKTLFNEFVTCFNDCDELILMDIYAAREKDTGLVSSLELGEEIRKSGVVCVNVSSHKEAAMYLKDRVNENDLVLTVGAGDVVRVGEELMSLSN